MKVKDYRTESDIPMNDSGFNIGQKVKMRKQFGLAKGENPTVYYVTDACWSVLDNSWMYTILKPAGTPWEVPQDSLLPS